MDIFLVSQHRSGLLPDPVERAENCGRCGLPIHGPSCLAEVVLRLDGERYFDERGNPLHPPDRGEARVVTDIKPVHTHCCHVLGVRPYLNGHDRPELARKHGVHAS